METHIHPSRLHVEKSAIKNHFPDFAEHVAEGLSSTPKKLSPMYLYDKCGSILFEKICDLPEYYLTRTEHSILDKYAGEIAAFSNGDMALIELGSGSSTKTRLIIEALIAHQNDLHYIPVDISETILVTSAKELLDDYPDLKITAHVAEYHTAIKHISKLPIEQKIVVFLGSNLGNFEPGAADNFLRKIRSWLNKDDYMLLSTDMQKDSNILEAAYNDKQGITAAFNMNILKRMNRELDADFDLDRFSHLAFYNSAVGRVEIHLRSKIDQQVYIGELDQAFDFKKGETIHTENSYKFTKGQIAQLCHDNGFRWTRQWTDEQAHFSVNLLSAA
ncbi:MAG: L-histidine N(alpha)-methyltransferase [bacterium]